jgi:hypothetical protein
MLKVFQQHIHQAISLEDTRHRYFTAVEEKIPIREVALHFIHMAMGNSNNKAQLEERTAG